MTCMKSKEVIWTPVIEGRLKKKLNKVKKKKNKNPRELFPGSEKCVERILHSKLIELQWSVPILINLSCIKYWNHTKLIKQERF